MMPIQSQKDQYGAFEPGPQVRTPTARVYDADEARLAGRGFGVGIPRGLNDPRRHHAELNGPADMYDMDWEGGSSEHGRMEDEAHGLHDRARQQPLLDAMGHPTPDVDSMHAMGWTDREGSPRGGYGGLDESGLPVFSGKHHGGINDLTGNDFGSDPDHMEAEYGLNQYDGHTVDPIK